VCEGRGGKGNCLSMGGFFCLGGGGIF